MYPAQTSLIPVQIALFRFIQERGFSGFFENYPYWYLGTTPFCHLSGPILPMFVSILHRVFPSFSLFNIFLGLIAIFWIIGGVGVWFLIKELSAENPLLGIILYVFGPLFPFFFRFSDGLYAIAFSLLPFALVLYLRFLKNSSQKLAMILIISISAILLIDILIFPSLLIGMTSLFLAQTGWKKVEKKIKRTLKVLVFSFLIITFWYTPKYWLISLSGPSLAGKIRLDVIFQLSKLLPITLGLVMAVFTAKFFKKRDLLRDFCFYWLFVFGFLTLMRFISDPDFWLDWSSYNLELQMGLAILVGLWLGRLINEATKVKKITFLILANVFLVAVWGIIFNKFILGTLQKEVNQTVEYRIGQKLSEINESSAELGKNKKVFLSGSATFWINAFFDIPQVRGGVDQGSVNAKWREAAWEIREGTEISKSLAWFRQLNIGLVVVHNEDSSEYYHDFPYPEKFGKTKSLRKIYEEKGDIIYQVLPN